MSDEMWNENDASLWKYVQDNNETAFAVLYKRYWSALFTTAFSYIKDKDACADIVHDIFISIWKRRQQLEIISFHHYLTNAARYKVYKHLQILNKIKILYANSFEDITGASSQNSAEEKLEYEALEKKLEIHLEELPKRCREIFIFSRKRHLTNEEIAKHLHISKRTVENQLTYALRHLRQVLGDVYIILFIIFCINLLHP